MRNSVDWLLAGVILALIVAALIAFAAVANGADDDLAAAPPVFCDAGVLFAVSRQNDEFRRQLAAERALTDEFRNQLRIARAQ